MRPRVARPVAGAVAALVGLGLSACTASSGPAAQGVSSVTNQRYCEILLVTSAGGLHADVYNTFPINRCPDAAWQSIDAQATARANGALAAIKNGPRHWLMSSISKVRSGPVTTKTFNGITMIEEATLSVTPAQLAGAQTPYTLHAVDRTTVFTYAAGSTIYELVSSAGQRYVMQSWSQQVDPTLQRSSLAGLGARLSLPAGWSYSSRTLHQPLRVSTLVAAASVLQDSFDNSYSLEAQP